MDKDRWNKIWGVSLLIMGLSTIVLAGAQIAARAAGQPLDVLVRVCGVVDLLVLPVFALATVKKLQNRR